MVAASTSGHPTCSDPFHFVRFKFNLIQRPLDRPPKSTDTVPTPDFWVAQIRPPPVLDLAFLLPAFLPLGRDDTAATGLGMQRAARNDCCRVYTVTLTYS